MSGAGASDKESVINLNDIVHERANQFKSIAKDSRNILRTNFLIIGFFLPVLGSIFTNNLPPERIFNNAYTQFGLIIWLISTILASYIYHKSRVVVRSLVDPAEAMVLGDIQEEEQRYRSRDKLEMHSSTIEWLDKSISVCTTLILIATTLFALGVLLPYVSIIPVVDLQLIVWTIFTILLMFLILYGLKDEIRSIKNSIFKEQKEWSDLNQPRKDFLKKIYISVGRESFQLWQLPLKHDRSFISGTLKSHTFNDDPILLRDISDDKISKYLLEQIVEEGYFKKEGNKEETVIKLPNEYGEYSVNEADNEIKTAIDRLGREIDSHRNALKFAADELSLRPNNVLNKLHEGDNIEKVQRYNRIIDRLQDEDFEISSRKFEFTSRDVRYVPTPLAQNAYDKIELEKERLEHEKEKREEQDRVRKSLNTHTYEILSPVNGQGMIEVFAQDISIQEGIPKNFNIHEARISEEKKEMLRDLDEGDKIQLRTEHYGPDGIEYIASVGNS